jgi:hypothetical protein
VDASGLPTAAKGALSISKKVDVHQKRPRRRHIHLLTTAADSLAHPEAGGPRPAQDAHEHEGGDADQKATCRGGHYGRQRGRLGPLDGMRLGQDGQRPNIVRLELLRAVYRLIQGGECTRVTDAYPSERS